MEIGDTLDGRFEITGIIRETGDGTEYAATDTYGHDVRIRELDVGKLEDWDAVKVFERKARLFERITHPGLSQYIDFFTDESGKAAGYYLAYSHPTGKSLRDIASGAAQSNGEELKRSLIDALKTLDYLHTFSSPLICAGISDELVIITPDSRTVICCSEFRSLAPGRDAGGDLKELGRAYAGAVKATYGDEDSPLKRELNEILGLMIAASYEARPVSAAKLAETLSREAGTKSRLDDEAESPQPKPIRVELPRQGGGRPIARPGSLQISEGYRTAGLRFANSRVGKTESLVPQILLNLWLGKPWVVILIAAFISGGPLFIPLLILHLYPGARAWMKKRYAKYCEVEIRVDDDTVSVPNQVERTRIDKVDRIEYLTYREENELRLEVTMTRIDKSRHTFYLAGISDDDALQVRDFLNRHVE